VGILLAAFYIFYLTFREWSNDPERVHRVASSA
jgi:hypothetical protein